MPATTVHLPAATYAVSFEIFDVNLGFFVEITVETSDVETTVANLRALPNVRNIQF